MTLRFTTTKSARPVAAATFIAKAKTVVLMASLIMLVLSNVAGHSVLIASGELLLLISCGLAVWSLKLYLVQTFTPKPEVRL